MPVNLSIKAVPAELAARLRERAAANHRSLQGELLAILHQAMEPGPVADDGWRQRLRRVAITRPADKATLDEVVARIKARGPQPHTRGALSVEIIRQMREERYGDASLASQSETSAARKPTRRGR